MKKSFLHVPFLFCTLITTISLCAKDPIADLPHQDTITTIRGPLDYNNATPLTITKPGIYKITGNMSASGVPVVQITADNVTLDLNGNTLDGGTTGINVAGNYVTIKNGTIQNPTDTGITLENAIGCNIDNCDIIGSATGIYLNNAHQNIITNIRSLSATNAGFSLVSSCTNYFEQCQVSGIQNPDNVYGFISENGAENILYKCYAQDIATILPTIVTTPGFSAHCAGFTLLGSEQKSSLLECYASNIHTAAPNESIAYGINLSSSTTGTLQSSTSVASSDIPGNTDAIDMVTFNSTQYLAAGNNTEQRIIVYEFNGSTLSEVTSYTTALGTINSIKWTTTNDRAYLAASVDTTEIDIFEFNATSSTISHVITDNTVGGQIHSICWLEDGINRYLATGGEGTYQMYVFDFDSTDSTLTYITQKQVHNYTAPNSYGNTHIESIDKTTHDSGNYFIITYFRNKSSIFVSEYRYLEAYSFNGSTLSYIASNGTSNADAELPGIVSCKIINSETTYILITGETSIDVFIFDGSTIARYLANLFPLNYPGRFTQVTWSNSDSYFYASRNNYVVLIEKRVDPYTILILADSSTAPDGTINSLVYSNSYLATGGDGKDQLTMFDVSANTLDTVTSEAVPGFPVYTNSWLSNNSSTYLATGNGVGDGSNSSLRVFNFNGLTLSTAASSAGFPDTIHATSWLVNNDTMYLGVGGEAVNDSNEISIFSFSGSSLSEITTSTLPDGTVYALDWARYNDTPYLATGGEGTNELKVFSFNGSSLSQAAASSAADGTIYALSWAIINGTYYLATGGQGTNEVRIFSFDGSSLTPITASSSADGTIYSVAWVIYNGTIYLAAGGEGTNKITLFTFNGSTLTPVTTSSAPDGTVNSLKWLVYKNNFYLASGGSASNGNNEVTLFLFDGTALTPLVTSSAPDGTVNAIDWTYYNDAPYLATGGEGTTSQLQILEFSNTATTLTPTNCIVKNCTAQNVSATITSISDDKTSGTGIGIKADSTQNFIASNYAGNNTTNYQDIESDYITSQANARGTYNIDGTLDTADQIPDILNKSDTIYNESWSIESKCEVIADRAINIPAQYPIEEGTVSRTALSGKTISQPGSYFLRENIDGDISITANNVILDLNGFTIDGNTTGINITGDKVTIKNGKIKNATTGIKLDSVTDCTIQECDIINATTGIYLSSASYNSFKNVRTLNSTEAGFSLVSSSINYFEQCKALKTQSTADTYGFVSEQGSNNVFYQCQVHDVSSSGGSTTTSITAAGFSFANLEHDSACIECIADGIQTTGASFNLTSGITLGDARTLIEIDTDSTPINDITSTKWLQYDNRTYLAVTINGANGYIYIYELINNTLVRLLSFSAASVLFAPENCSWLTYNSSIYLAAGGTRSSTFPATYVYKFDPDTPSLTVIDSITISDYQYGVDWQIINGTPYLAYAGYPGTLGYFIIIVASFDGSSLTTIDSYLSAATYNIPYAWDAKWLNANGSYYIAVAGELSSAGKIITILQFASETTLSEVASQVASTGDNVYSVSWLTYNGNYYLAAAFNDANGPEQVQIYQFDPSGPSLTLVDSYDWPGYVRYVAWILDSTNTPYLAAAYSSSSSPYNIRVFTFDGTTLSVITETEQASYDGYTFYSSALDWLEQDNTLYLSTGIHTYYPSTHYYYVKLFEFAGVHDCIVKNCIAKNSTALTAYDEHNQGIGIKADSLQNSISLNYACSNDVNYEYVSPQYITSQANMHGIDNVDCSRTEVDEYASKLDVIITNITP